MPEFHRMPAACRRADPRKNAMLILLRKSSVRGNTSWKSASQMFFLFAFHFGLTHIAIACSPCGERAYRDMIKGRITR